jgi:predicted kinase
MVKTMFILQGAPGSGKSKMAEALMRQTAAEDFFPAIICSTDRFFMVNDKYMFDRTKLAEYHGLNQDKAKYYLENGYSVIIDNTNIKKIHVEPYVKIAKETKAQIQIIRCYGKFQNLHGVPEEIVQRMRNEMEDLSELLND